MQCHHLPLENRKLFDFLIGNSNLISASLATMLPFEGLRAIFRLFRFSRSIVRLLRRLRFSQRNQGPDRGACCSFGIKPIDAACAIRPRDVQVRPLSPIGGIFERGKLIGGNLYMALSEMVAHVELLFDLGDLELNEDRQLVRTGHENYRQFIDELTA